MTTRVRAERDLPSSWRWARLREHVTKVGSGATPLGGQAVYVQSGIPFVRSQNVQTNRFTPEGLAHILPEHDAALSGTRVEPGDILLNITGASIGRACVVPAAMCPANVSQHVSIIRSDGSFDPHYLSYYLSTPWFQKGISESQAGATRQALTKQLVEDFRFPLPPLAEQKRIVAILNEQMALVDHARAAAEAQLAAAQALPAAHLRDVFESAEAKEWPRRRLGEVSHLLPARTIATDGDTDVLAVTTASLSEVGFQPAGVKRARMWAAAAEDALLSVGEVLIARSNTSDLVGRAAAFEGEPPDAVASDLTIRVMPLSLLQSRFLAAYLSSLYSSGYWRNRAGGASGSMKKITRRQVIALAVPVPPEEVQARVTDHIDRCMTQGQKLAETAAAQIRSVSRLPDALLAEAFRGEL